MSESKNSTYIIWAAIIALIGTVTVGVLNNWEKFYPPQVTPTALESIPTESTTQKPSVPVLNPKPTTGKNNVQVTPVTVRKIEKPSSIEREFIDSVVTGQVVDKDGQPLGSREVHCVDCLTENVAITNESGHFKLPFRVEKDGNLQHIQLYVKGFKHPFHITVNDPKGHTLQLQ